MKIIIPPSFDAGIIKVVATISDNRLKSYLKLFYNSYIILYINQRYLTLMMKTRFFSQRGFDDLS